LAGFGQAQSGQAQMGTEGNHPFSSGDFAFGKIPDSLSGQFPSVPDLEKVLN